MSILSAIPVVGPIVDGIVQGTQNRKNRQFAMQMYNTQRQDALADWKMQTAYNSPIEQMKRLKEAGLNPNLVYDNGATTQASPVRSVNADVPEGKAPQIAQSLTSGIMAQYDIEQKKVGVDMLKQQIEASKVEANLKAAQILKTYAETDLNKLDIVQKQQFNEQFKNLMPISLEAANLQNTKTIAEIGNIEATTRRVGEEVKKIGAEILNVEGMTQYMKGKGQREAMELFQHIRMNNFNIKKGLEEIAEIKARTAKTEEEKKNVEQLRNVIMNDNRIKNLQAELDKIKLAYEKANIAAPGHGNWIEVMERMLYNAAQLWRDTR